MKHTFLNYLTIAALPVASLTLAPNSQAQDPKSITANKNIPIAVGNKLDASLLPQEWINGAPVSEFKDGVVYVIDLWESPKKGRRSSRFYRRAPGYHHRLEREKYVGSSSVQFFSICINGEKDKERLNYFLALPEFQSAQPSAIALDAFEGKVVSQWVRPSNISYIPYSLVLKGSQVIWHGESDTMSRKLLGEAVKPDFSIAKFEEMQKQESQKFRNFADLQQELGKAKKEGASKQELLKEIEAAKPHYPSAFRQSSLASMESYVNESFGDKAAAIEALEKVTQQFPGDETVLKSVLKMLNLRIALKPESEGLREKVLIELAGLTDSRYASSCWRMVAEIREESGDTAGAIEAYQSSVNVSRPAEKLRLLKAGKTPPLTQ